MNSKFEVNVNAFVAIGETSEAAYRSASDWFKRIGQCYAVSRKLEAYRAGRSLRLTKQNVEENESSLIEKLNELAAVMLSKTAQINRLGNELGAGEVLSGFTNKAGQQAAAEKALFDWYRKIANN
jgi:hypothetical protein